MDASKNPNSQPKAKEADVQWYDKFYQEEQRNLPPWYRFLLPELLASLGPSHKLVELGCGQAHILRLLASSGALPESNITGIDQSNAAVEFSSKRLPKARILVDDIYQLKSLAADEFDACLLMETIEHLENPEPALAAIKRVLKPGARLYLSFPNFVHLPWLVVRILAEKLNRPNWVVLQPVDKIYTTFKVISLLRKAGFRFLKGIGCSYGPPVLYPLETDGMTRLLNKAKLWHFSFHPILVFEKPKN